MLTAVLCIATTTACAVVQAQDETGTGKNIVSTTVTDSADMLSGELGEVSTEEISESVTVVKVAYSGISNPETVSMHLQVKSNGRAVRGFVVSPQSPDATDGEVEFTVQWEGVESQQQTSDLEVTVFREYEGSEYEMLEQQFPYSRLWAVSDDWEEEFDEYDDGDRSSGAEDIGDTDYTDFDEYGDGGLSSEEGDYDAGDEDEVETLAVQEQPSRENYTLAARLYEASKVAQPQTDEAIWQCDDRRCYGLKKSDLFSVSYSATDPTECRQLASQVGAVGRYIMKPGGDQRLSLSRDVLSECNKGIAPAMASGNTEADQGKNKFVINFLKSTGKESLSVGGKRVSCAGTSCNWRTNDSSPSVSGCKKYRAAIGGYVTRYGKRGAILTPAQLHSCNGSSGKYLYSISVEDIDREKLVKRNGKTALCLSRGNTCTWMSNDSSVSVNGCKGWRSAIGGGDVRRYGMSGKGLSSSNVSKCNR